MTAAELYAWLKNCLEFFGLAFKDMDKMNIMIKDSSISAKYEEETIILRF